jgi:hypothetical protein
MEMEARDGIVRMTVGCPAAPSRHARSDLALLNSNTLDTCPPKSASIQNKPAKRYVYAKYDMTHYSRHTTALLANMQAQNQKYAQVVCEDKSWQAVEPARATAISHGRKPVDSAFIDSEPQRGE